MVLSICRVNISGCSFTFSSVCLQLSGSFSVTGNTFTSIVTDRCIDIFYHRGSSTVKSNTFVVGQCNNIIKLTKNTSDFDSSKGGSITIDSNVINYQGTTCAFLFNDYYNQYLTTSSDYNLNTKLSLNVTNNTINSVNSVNSIKLTEFIVSHSSFACFGTVNVNGNTVSVTDYGAVHLNKTVTNTQISIDTSTSTFKISNNVLQSSTSGLMLQLQIQC